MKDNYESQDWEACRLGNEEIATLVMGQSPSSTSYNDTQEGLPFFQGKADFGLRSPVARKWCTEPARIAEAGDILISVRAPVGDVNIASVQSCIGRGLAAIRPGPRVIRDFLFYALMNEKERLDSLGSGATFKAINKDTLLTFTLRIPGKGLQRRIAHILNTLQRGIALQEELEMSFCALRTATFEKMFHQGLRGERTKHTELGPLPDSWSALPLERTITLAQYGLSVRGEKAGKYPILRMNCQVDGAVVFRNLQYVDLDQDAFESFCVHDGDLLFNRTNSYELVGRTALFSGDRPAVFASYLIRLAVRRDVILPSLLNHYLNMVSTQSSLKALATRGVSQSNISASKLKTFVIPVPKSLDEQREMVNVMDSISKRINLAREQRTALEQAFNSMLQQLMSGTLEISNLLELEHA